MTRRYPTQGTIARLGAALALALVLVTTGSPIVAHAKPSTTDPPQLSISVDNGRDAAARGDRLSYTITVTNLGTTRVKNLVVTQGVPTGATFVSAGQDGKEKAGSVSWKVDVKATKKATLHAAMTVRSTPDTLLRLASVSCAKVSPKAAPIVCATDSDLLPAGAAAATVQVARVRPAGLLDSPSWRYAGAGLGLVLVAGALTLVVRRRRAR